MHEFTLSSAQEACDGLQSWCKLTICTGFPKSNMGRGEVACLGCIAVSLHQHLARLDTTTTPNGRLPRSRAFCPQRCASCMKAVLVGFSFITQEDKDILESTDPDAVIDLRRRGIEYPMASDRPEILKRRK